MSTHDPEDFCDTGAELVTKLYLADKSGTSHMGGYLALGRFETLSAARARVYSIWEFTDQSSPMIEHEGAYNEFGEVWWDLGHMHIVAIREKDMLQGLAWTSFEQTCKCLDAGIVRP